MSKRRYNAKLERALTFLAGSNDPEVLEFLSRYGFNQQVLDEAWRDLRQAFEERRLRLVRPPRRKRHLAVLDRWENFHHPLVSAVLARLAPAIHAQVFKDLPQTSGTELLVTVPTFLDRLQALRDASAGTPERAAWDLLVAHGFDPAAMGEARALVAEATSVAAAEATVPEPVPAGTEALDAIWSWYLQWSRIARLTIPDARVLAKVGLRVRRKARVEVHAAPANDDKAAPAEKPAEKPEDKPEEKAA